MIEIDEMIREGLLSIENIIQDIRMEEWLKGQSEIDEMINEGLLTVEDIIQDIRMEEWLNSRIRCPICGYGDVVEKCCDFCAWEFENNQGSLQESSHISCDNYDNMMKRFNIDVESYVKSQKKLAKKGYGLKPVKRGSRSDDKPMNAGLQEHLLRKKLKKEFGDGADHYDPKTMIDSDLHYDERLKGLGFATKKRDDEAYYEENYLDHQCKVTGKDRETILAENKAKKDAALYESIHTLANINTFREFEDAGNISTIRTSVFKKSAMS